MGEDHIEIAHQRRHCISPRSATNQNKKGNMKMQAKYERIIYNESIIDVKKTLIKKIDKKNNFENREG